MRVDVRIRIRGHVIRISVGEACIRAVIRITAEQDTTRATNLFYLFEIESITITAKGDSPRKLIHLTYLL